jgi:transcriptional regulator with XRE-family HTH domain
METLVQPYSSYDSYVADILRAKARELFGSLLKLLCRRAGITQDKLERDSRAYREELIARGLLQDDNNSGSMNQSAISRVMKGIQPPTYDQVRIWLEVIDRVYKSDKFREICNNIGWPYKDFFTKELKIDMYRLALFGTPEEVVAAYEQWEDLPLQNKKKLSPSVYRSEPQSDQLHNTTFEVRRALEEHC